MSLTVIPSSSTSTAGRRVRLIGADTPETVHPRKPVGFYGKEASRFTTNLLKGESIYLEYDQQRQDRYGRTLAYLYRAPDGLFINLEIVRQGYSHADTKYPFKYVEWFGPHEHAAREAGRGLWGEGVVPSDQRGEQAKPASAEGEADKAGPAETATCWPAAAAYAARCPLPGGGCTHLTRTPRYTITGATAAVWPRTILSGVHARKPPMPVPQLLPTAAPHETVAGITYHIDGELVPVLQLELHGQSVFFEHHILLWKDPHVEIGLKSLAGGFNRFLSGLPVFMTEAKGTGRIAFSRDGVGHVFAIHLRPGEGLDVREHQFLAATESVEFTSTTVKGFKNIFFGGSGLIIDHFFCRQGNGVLWLHGYGNVFETTLNAGEEIDIEPGAWVYKDPSVTMDTHLPPLETGLFGGTNLALNRFTGPGRVAFQSMYHHMPDSK